MQYERAKISIFQNGGRVEADGVVISPVIAVNVMTVVYQQGSSNVLYGITHRQTGFSLVDEWAFLRLTQAVNAAHVAWGMIDKNGGNEWWSESVEEIAQLADVPWVLRMRANIIEAANVKIEVVE